MIHVTIIRNSNSDYIGFDILGHAGYDEAGKDIVCSAVSAIAITTVNSIEELAGGRFTCDCEQKSGAMSLRIEDVPDQAASVLMKAFVIGMKGLCDSYGDYVCMTFKEV